MSEAVVVGPLTVAPAEGRVTALGHRGAVMPGALWRALRRAIDAQTGESNRANQLLFAAGEAWGREAFEELSADCARTRGIASIGNLPVTEFSATVNGYLGALGYGVAEFAASPEAVFVDIGSPPFEDIAGGSGPSGAPVLAGFWSGFFRTLIGAAVEIKDLGNHGGKQRYQITARAQ